MQLHELVFTLIEVSLSPIRVARAGKILLVYSFCGLGAVSFKINPNALSAAYLTLGCWLVRPFETNPRISNKCDLYCSLHPSLMKASAVKAAWISTQF